MTAEHWRRVAGVLDQVLAVSGDGDEPLSPDTPAIAAILDRTCSGDPELKAEVVAFLEAEARVAFLQSDAVSFAGPELRSLGPLIEGASVGDRIGPYQLVQEIGRGGSSVVYLARRDDAQFAQQVAIKLLSFFGETPDRIRRFETERRILASLDHPGIARIYDGGVTERGMPYLVMEYVDGERLTTFCDRRGLPVAARVDLFEQVCAAVQFAHQRLVVHRDLKPGNIMVTAAGVPKLLDFGIAKLLDTGGEGDELTRTGMRLMTPEYAAPEQVRAEPVTTGTDVYALGVILYEMLAGNRPYDVGAVRLSEIEKIICNTEPRPPSAVAAPANAKALVGDLDTIVLKALRKEPAERYATAAALADDLRRYRVGLPVEARPQTLVYRTQKFVRRHRTGVTLTAAITLLVLGSSIALAVQRAATERERDRAAQEAAKAQEVTRFVTTLFEASDPREALGDTLTAMDLLERGAARAEAVSEPAVRASVLAVIGRAYRSLGRFDEAERLADSALAIREAFAGPADRADLAESLEDLGRLAADRGRFDSAEVWLRRAVGMREADSAAGPVQLAGALGALGRTLLAQAEFDAADSAFGRSLALRRAVHGPSHAEVARALADLGDLELERGKVEAAESLHVAALDLRRGILPPTHPDLASSITSVAFVRRRLGRFAEAEAGYREALAIGRAVYPQDHPDIARKLGNLGVVLGIQAKLDEAESVMREELAMWRRIHGNRHPDVATALNNLGRVAEQRGDLELAERLSREVLDLRRGLFAPSHPIIAASLDNLALLLAKRGRLVEAERMHRDAVALERARLGDGHPETAISRANLAWVIYRQGRFAEAETEARAVLEIRRAALGPEHPDVATSLRTLGLILRDKGALNEAEPVLQESLRLRRAALGDEHPRVAEVLDFLGVLFARKGQHAEADSLLRRALAIREARLGASHPDVATTKAHLAALDRSRLTPRH